MYEDRLDNVLIGPSAGLLGEKVTSRRTAQFSGLVPLPFWAV